MPHRLAIQHLLITTRSGAMSGIDYALIALGALLASLLLSFD